MDRYQVADKPNGPWIELVVTNNPAQALAKARASFDWPIIWVAKMRPIAGEDLLPPAEIFWSDMREYVALYYGATTADELDQMMGPQAFDYLTTALTGALLDHEVEVFVPSVKRSYGKNQEVRAVDFTEDDPVIERMKERTRSKPSLKALLSDD